MNPGRLSPQATEAAAWRARLAADDVSEAEFAAFEEWISRPGSREAFDRLDRLEALIGDERVAFGERLDARRPISRWVIGGAALGLAALVSLVASGPHPASRIVDWTVVAADKTSIRTASLPDGSTVEVNRGGAVRVAITAQSRRVAMADAEAYFEVAHNRAVPFTVEVGGDTVTAVGTAFNIASHGPRTSVNVVEGVVEVAYVEGGRTGAVRLAAGDELVHERGGAISLTHGVGAVRATAWRTGRLIYENASLADVAADLGRYFDRPIRLNDDIAGLRFSGTLVVDDEDRVAARLAAFLPIDVSSTKDEIVLSRRGGR